VSPLSRNCFIAFVLITGLVSSSFAQKTIVAPVEKNAFSRLTSYDTLQSFISALASRRGITVERIAVTQQGRNVSAVHITSTPPFGSDPSKLRVMIHAQQHGDEPSGKEAMTMLLARLASGRYDSWLKTMDIIIVPQMNPDGSELRQRRTSDSLDMNRNHLILTLAETKGLHDLFWRWKPEVTLDVHEYTSSKEWRDSGMVRLGDVLLGTLTHPNTSEKIRTMQHQGMKQHIAGVMKKARFNFHEYIVGSPDTRLRQSTTEINDGRQSFGILGTMSFIQEGLKWAGLEDSLRRRASAQFTSIEAFLEYCAGHAGEIRTLVQAERAQLPASKGISVALRTEREEGEEKIIIPVHNLRTKKDTVWNVQPYQSVVVTYASDTLPAGYVIPAALAPVAELLRRHNITIETVTKKRVVNAQVYTMDSIAVEIVEEDPKPKPYGRWNEEKIALVPGDIIVRTSQLHAVMLAIALEPESVWGLIGYPGYEQLLNNPGRYPISRIVN
jgi:hypothetical protein